MHLWMSCLFSVPFVQAIKFIPSTNTVFCSVYLVPSANLQVGMLLLFLLSRASADAGMVSMLPTVNPDLFKIDGGNVQVPQLLLEHAHPDLHKTNVTKIVKSSDGTFQIETQDSSHVGSVYCICQHACCLLQPCYGIVLFSLSLC